MSIAHCFCFLLILPLIESIYTGKTNYFMRYKIVNLDKELTLDAIMNVRRVQHFPDTYSIDDSFFVGRLVYRIRDKYTRMVRLYMLCYNNFDEYDINTFIADLMEIQQLSMEIDSLVEHIFDYYWPGKSQGRPAGKHLAPGVTLPPDITLPTIGLGRSGRVVTRHPKPTLFKTNNKNYDQAIVKFNIAGKDRIDDRNKENNGGGFDSDIY